MLTTIKPRHFRPNTYDEVIFKHVVEGEYGPIDFAGKRVLDIGAHIGGFSVLAASSGAKLVHAFEVNAENFELLVQNCDGLPVVCHRAAVWRSDVAEKLRWIPSADVQNTGGGGVTAWVEGSDAVTVEAFDDVVLAFDPFDVCKLDCEGSEYQILMTSKFFLKVPLFVGEYHPDARTPALFDLLQRSGYDVEDRPVHSGFGKFTARRR